ncbi:hypothetical protein EIP91_010996 [Steccherinum ochraceum]|uniref:F-box domain-containing protein n=1 Tax=Steccherinum ochraceum TaxID=92696 RepID=A0A4R0RWI9_9APHY|nr:hypothetical protein EIP91_010996 [Steccherinum ochraceum]
MHPIFHIPELVNLIVQHLAIRGLQAVDSLENSEWLYDKAKEAINPLDQMALQDIKALGQASKVFTEACLNEAWLSQTGVVGLLRLVDAVEELPRDGLLNLSKWRVSRQLTENDIPVLLRHSSRIQELALSSTQRLVDTEGAKEMLSFGRAVILFPRLRTLSRRASGTAELDFVISTVGDDCLTDMSAVISGPIPPNFLVKVEERRRYLRSLYLSSAGHSKSDIGRTVKMVLAEPTGLAELHILDDISEHINVWDAAAQLPRLTKLTLRDAVSSSLGPSSVVTYHQLVVFDLRMGNPDTFIHAMNSVVLPSLQSFEIAVVVPTSTHRPLDVLSAISRSCDKSPLRSLSISISPPREPPRPSEEILGPDSLDVLMRFPLTRLEIGMSWPWNLTDSSMEKIARAWPNIAVLDLDPAGDWPIPSNVTTDGLELLSQLCPRLRMLGIQFNSAPPDFYRAEELYYHVQGRVWNATLNMLAVGRSVIDSPQNVALFLSCLFPNLETCLPQMPAEEAHELAYQQWTQVSKFLPAMGLARRQERWWDDA